MRMSSGLSKHLFANCTRFPLHQWIRRGVHFFKSTMHLNSFLQSEIHSFCIVKCAHYQTLVWKQTHICKSALPSQELLGWKKSDEGLVPELMLLNPVPSVCLEMITCQCGSGCNTLRCKCRKSKLLCTAACGCHQKAESTCVNVPAN